MPAVFIFMREEIDYERVSEQAIKTRQDNVLFGVLYSPMYINFTQIILNYNTNCTLVEL